MHGETLSVVASATNFQDGISTEVLSYYYSISTSVTNGTASGATLIEKNGTATVTITADRGYELPEDITVSGASYTYDSATGAVALSNATGNVAISAECVAVATDVFYFSSPSSFTLEVVDHQKYWDGTLEYSTDAANWNTWGGTNSIASGNENKLYLRGTNNTVITGTNGSSTKARWQLTGQNITVNGNIESLLDYVTVAGGQHPTMADYCFNGLLRTNADLTEANVVLPATTLVNSCYSNMFYGCTSLTTAPVLPATTLASNCYFQMFRNCTSLSTASALPATTLADYCYSGMFQNCPSLTTVPALPATTLVQTCYANMFLDCTSIKMSTSQTGEYQTEYRIPTSGTGTSTTQMNPLYNMFGNTGGTFTGTPLINTTYYTSNTVIPST
jgi:hypothetical protein